MESLRGVWWVVVGVLLLSGEGCGGKVGKREDLSEETVLLREKLNQILDVESKEVSLLKGFMDEQRERGGEEEEEQEGKKEVPGEGGKSLEFLRENGIVTKLEENSKRMEKMVVFLVDLRNLLTEALAQQNREMAGENEMVEIREEMEYLRKELEAVKKEQKRSKEGAGQGGSGGVFDSNPGSASVSRENQRHNDHATLEWLKTSTQELRTQLTEISDQCNATLIMSLREKVHEEGKRRDENLAQAERTLETLRLGQLRHQEELREAKEDIQDLRSWQGKMGAKMVTQMWGESNNEESNEVEEERGFITEELKDAVGKPNMRHHQSHKRIKSKLHQLQQLIQDLTQTNKNHEKRLAKLEGSQRTLKSLVVSALSSSSSSSGRGRSPRSLGSFSLPANPSAQKLASVQKSLQEYVFTLSQLNDKVSGMDELQESTTQLFRSLEQLEKKYDDRVGEIQTGMARLESGMSGVLVSSEDLKEQQTQQSSVIQSVKKDLFQVKGKLQTNHLRLAALQSQMVKWASHKCSDENSESIQNIRIATLEQALLEKSNEAPPPFAPANDGEAEDEKERRR